MSTLASPIDRLRELGGELFLAGDVIRYRIPSNNQEARKLLAEIRKDPEAVLSKLQDRESQPPLLSELKFMLPQGILVIRYEQKPAPFAVAPVNVVTNAGKFFRAYLGSLKTRVEKPDGYHCPPLADILGKLADAGLKLRVER